MLQNVKQTRYICSRIVPVRVWGAMSTKHVRTTADLVRFKCALKVTCDGCGNARTLAAYDAVRAFGALDDLQILRRRLKCSLCGSKTAKLTVLSPPAPRG
jgi:hypothetical protein